MRLDEIEVLDLTQLLPGPYATQLLADMGAEVIKIEHPNGGEAAREIESLPGWEHYLFKAVNDGKKSAALDLKDETEREDFYRVVEKADAVIEQFRPGVAERLHVDYETLKQYNSELVYCSLSGYGQETPHRDKAGHDLNYQGESGLLDMTRCQECKTPTIPGFPVADMASGLFAALSIVSSLLSRELGATGGNYIDLAMSDVVLSLGQVDASMAINGEDVETGQTTQTAKYPCYDVYETADGEHVTLAATEPPFWAEFCEALNRADLINNHRSESAETREWLRDELSRIFSSRTWDEWKEKMDDLDNVAVGPVNSVATALDSDHFDERDFLETTADGFARLGYPAKVLHGLDPEQTAPPEVGEHTEKVLEGAGRDLTITEE